MTFQWRYVILCAVSSEEQVKTKDGNTKKSLDFQYEVSRAWGDRNGGTFIRDYRAEGFSRTGWYDFTEALAACKEFDELARDAHAHKFDVILMESFDRLGDLAVMWFTYLERKVGAPFIQIRSVQKPLIIDEPALYNPRHDDSTPDALNDAQKINRYRISKIVRAGEVGIPDRAKAGKYARKPPYGYRDAGDRKTYKPELDPVVKAIALKMKDMYLREGASLHECARYAEQIDPGKNWNSKRVQRILTSPFYAGFTYYTLFDNDPRTGTAHRKEKPELYPGLQEAAWDYDTHLQLVAEVDRRGEYGRRKLTYPLSGLGVCGECGHPMYINSSNHQTYSYFRCQKCKWSAPERVVNEKFREWLRSELPHYDQPRQEIGLIDNSKAIAKLKKELRKVQIAYRTTDAYTPEEFDRDVKEIRDQIAMLSDQEYQQEKRRQEMAQAGRGIERLREILGRLDSWMGGTPAGEVNATIAQAVQTVTMFKDGRIQVQLL